MERSKILVMVEGAVMVALATGLSLLSNFIPFLKLPWGGSITLLSMLPIVVNSIRNGVKSGLACSFVYSVVQLVIGMFEVLGWGLTPTMLAACFFFDYIGAFTVLGLAGLFRKRGMSGWIGGTVMAITLRYVMHVISGAAVFASVGMLWDVIEINNPWLYSMAYNACYMLPELIFTTIGAVALFKSGAIKMILKGNEATV
ncbi:MAG: energy-coupled thiamine transporter ThiT [Oscillospiraceae bacterium]|nr:energy-coupled thiamine transporter ThiT [Oscillospiraceae bacterium]